MAPRTFPVRLVDRITDGDTYWPTVEVAPAWSAFRLAQPATLGKVEVRLDGYDCPESKSSATRVVSAFERQKSREAAELVRLWFGLCLPHGVTVTTEADPDKYGRWLGEFVCAEHPDWSSSLGETLEAAHLAVPYDGTAKTHRWFQVYDQPQA